MTVVARIALVLGLVGLLAAAWWLAGSDDTAPAPAVAQHAAPAPDTTPAAAVAGGPDASGPSPANRVAEPRRDSVPDLSTTTVSGRCVDEGGAGIAECTVFLQGVRGVRVTTTSDASGTFALRCEPAARVSVQLVAFSAQHVETTLSLGVLTAGQARRVGDLRLLGGSAVAGRVVDVRGQPVANLAVNTAPVGEAWETSPRTSSAVTDTDGRFVLDRALAPGRWLLRADPREFDAPALFTLVPGERRHELMLTLLDRHPPATISGKVVDARGHPVAYVDVAVHNSDTVAAVVSKGDGAFRLVGWDHTGEAELVLLPRNGEPEEPPQRAAWDSENVRLVWRHGTELEVAVRRDDGTAVAGAQVHLIDHSSALDERRPVAQVHLIDHASALDERRPVPSMPFTDAGGMSVRHVATSGRYLVSATAPGLVALDRAAVALGATGRVRADITMATTVQRTLTVQTQRGEPVASARVSLWQGEVELVPAGERAPPQLWHWSSTAFDSRFGWRIGEAVTDARGRCVLQAPAHLIGCLRVFPSRHAPLVREGIRLAAMPEPWVETVGTGAVVEGRLDPARAQQASMLRLERHGEGPRDVFPEGFGPRQIGADGSFCLRAVPPGSWRLQLVTSGLGIVHLADVFDLREGETRRVELGSGEAPAELAGTMRWNGRPWQGGFALVRIDGSEAGDDVALRVFDRRVRHVSMQADGTFRILLPPGRYRAAIGHGMGGQGRLPLDSDLVLAAGTSTECALNLRSRAARVRLLRRGHPVPGIHLRVVAAERFTLRFNPTDDYGCSEFAVPLGTHPLFAQRGGGAPVALGTIDVVAGEGPQIFAVEVPAALLR